MSVSRFKQYGGINRSAQHNVVRSRIITADRTIPVGETGLQNSKTNYLSHIDMQGNSLIDVGTIYFQDGSSQSSAVGNTGPAGEAATISIGTTSQVSYTTAANVTNNGSSSAAVLNFTIPAGQSPNISIGNVSTIAAGNSATASFSGTSLDLSLNLGLVTGNTGANGTAATVSVGTTTQANSETAANVSYTGTSSDLTLNFTIPAGATPALTIGNVTTVAAGGSASANITGTTAEPVLNLGLVTGATGSGTSYWSNNSAGAYGGILYSGPVEVASTLYVSSSYGNTLSSNSSGNLTSGGYMSWNGYTGSLGEVDFVCNRGTDSGATGGFMFFDNSSGTNTLLAGVAPNVGLYAAAGVQPRWCSGWFYVAQTGMPNNSTQTLSWSGGNPFVTSTGNATFITGANVMPSFLVNTSVSWTTTTLPTFKVYFSNTSSPTMGSDILADISSQTSLDSSGNLAGGFAISVYSANQVTLTVSNNVIASVPTPITSNGWTPYTYGFYNLMIF